MNETQLEARLRAHSRRVKTCMASPFEQAEEHTQSSPANERKENHIKMKKLITVIAVAAALVCMSTAFAAGGYQSWLSMPAESYDSLPEKSRIEQEIGYAPVLIEEFENGFSYQTGYVVDNEIVDESGEAKESFRSASLVYERSGETVWFSQEKYPGGMNPQGELSGSFEGVDVYFYSYMNKIVPEDYVLTAEDEAAKQSGELVFSWGSDSVQLTRVSTVQWMEDGISYCLLHMGDALSAEEMTAMAAEAIAFEN